MKSLNWRGTREPGSIMRREGLPPYEIAAVVRTIFQQAGIDIPEYVVKVPEYEQLSFSLMMGR